MEIDKIHEFYSKNKPRLYKKKNEVEIPLRNNTNKVIEYAIIDFEDAIRMMRYTYYTDSYGYALCKIKNQKMHHMVLGQAEDLVVDHINNNRLDNRKSNLRFATRSQNSQNKAKPKGCTSQYKGVCLKKNKWTSRVGIDGKRIYLGDYDHEIDAAKMYDVHIVYHHGINAKTNNLLTQKEKEWIVKNGILPGYEKKEKKKKELPVNIYINSSGTYAVTKQFNGEIFNKWCNTLEEAIEWRDNLEKKLKDTAEELHNEKEITKTKDGIAYISIIKNEEEHKILVDDDLWHDLMKTPWHINGLYPSKHNADVAYLMHRYVWIKMKGAIPKNKTIDHVDRNKFDNRIKNLRLASASLQVHNRNMNKCSLLKYRSVKCDGTKFYVVIRHKYIGSYDTEEEAADAANKINQRDYGDDAELNDIDWSKKTTIYNLIPKEIINEDFIENLNTLNEIVILSKRLGATKRNGGPFDMRRIKIEDMEEMKGYLIDNLTKLLAMID